MELYDLSKNWIGYFQTDPKDWEKINFTGTIGSIFHNLHEFADRFNNLSNNSKNFLKILKIMNIFRLFEKTFKFPINWIIKLTQLYDFQLDISQANEEIEYLYQNYFINFYNKSIIQPNIIYLEQCVEYEEVLEEIIDNLITIFKENYLEHDLLIKFALSSSILVEYCYNPENIFEKLVDLFLSIDSTLDKNENEKFQHFLGYFLSLAPKFTKTNENIDKAINYLENSLKRAKKAKDKLRISSILYELGNLYKKLAFFKKAERFYKGTIQNYPNFTEAWVNLGVIYYLEEKYSDAEMAYKEALKINEEDEYALYNLGVVYQQLGKIDLAIIAYEKSLEINPELFPSCFSLGNYYLERKDYLSAEKNFLRYLEITNINNSLVFSRDHGLIRFSEVDSSKIRTARIINYPPPKISVIYFGLSEIQHNSGKIEKAIELTEKALEYDKTNTIYMVKLGLLYEEKGLKEKAEFWFRKALKIDPNFDLGWKFLGDLYRIQDPYLAIDSYNKYLLSNPKDHQIWSRIAMMHISAEDFVSAEVSLRKSIEIEPNNTNYLNNLGKLLFQMKRFDESINYLERVILLDEKNSISWGHLGMIYLEKQRLEDAENSFRKAYLITPNNFINCLNYGMILFQRKKKNECKTIFEHALQLIDENQPQFNIHRKKIEELLNELKSN